MCCLARPCLLWKTHVNFLELIWHCVKIPILPTGLNYLNEDIADDTTTQVITIWCITFVATISTASGVGMGIRRLSEICFALGMFLMTMVLLLEDTW